MHQFVRFPILMSFLLLWRLMSPTATFAGENYAFLVAVGDYDPKQLHRLPYSRNDVLAFYDVLLQSGFKKENVTLMHDDPKNSLPARLLPESAKIRKQLTLILSGRDEEDTIILAFAGHGVQFKGDASSYYCPLDVDLEKKETLLPLGEVYEALKACPAKRKLLLVDACRNDPRTQVSRSRATVDLESITRPQKQSVPESVVAFFSCAEGQQSFEWPELKHGVFFYHVLDVWKKGVDGQKELTLDDMVYQTRKRTEAFARTTLEASQTPELHGKSAGKWVLRTYDAKVVNEFTNSLGMTLVRIPAGEYPRGTPAADVERMLRDYADARRDNFDDEQPQHRVRIANDFYLGRYEVTQGEWKALMGSAPWAGKPNVRDGKDFAAAYLSWDNAEEFCRKLSLKDGVSYRLPAEAEWEYACRGGTTTRFGFGDEDGRIGDHAWYGGLSGFGNAMNERYAHPVGLKKPNRFGLFDMHGNVWEWCQDAYDPKEYAKYLDKTTEDPRAAPNAAVQRVMRGGGWNNSPRRCRSASRGGNPPSEGYFYTGFRVLAVRPPQ
ncbi:MAG: SUMF1/EgtB/PvdO family nonheme iron enzyme [Planctomycetaceae bacterium]|nr:SUMF1/EgtB/PvdO family nonheme iron enzyme [Planctomycetaceae bacterium]